MSSHDAEAWKLKPADRNPLKRLSFDLLLLALSMLLFSLSFPGFISIWGWFPLAYFAIFPIFIVIRRNNWLGVVLLGFLYGYGAYALFNFWLSKFHPLANIIVPVIFGVYFMVLFPALKLADKLYPRNGFLVQFLIWMAFEFVRTLGFAGYSYGIMGYSQYLFLPLIRISSLTGVWGVTALVVFPSVYLGNALKDVTSVNVRSWLAAMLSFHGRHRFSPIVYAGLFCLSIVYGLLQKSDFSDQSQWRVALIQQNIDPWHGGDKAYRQSFEIHARLSTEVQQKEDLFYPSL